MSGSSEFHADLNRNDFTSKEHNQILSLKEKISNRGLSTMEKQIAQAELDDLLRSTKEPAPHNHKHSISGLPEQSVRGGSSNIYHDDEAFEKYEMGQERPQYVDKSVNQEVGSRISVKKNHKVRGSLKERTEKDFEDIAFHEGAQPPQ